MTGPQGPFLVQIRKTDGTETILHYADEKTARDAWCAAINSDERNELAYARVEHTEIPSFVLGRYRCEWSADGTHVDRTDLHREELAHVVALLTRDAPPGYTATVEIGHGDFLVVFEGPNGQRHTLLGAPSSTARVLAHWLGFAPRRPTDEGGTDR